MKLAYLILGHTSPLQILRTIERLRAPGTTFVVHIDARTAPEIIDPIRAQAATHPDILLAPQQSCYWGTYGIVAAEFACIATLLASARPFDYAILLSGQDYPIKPPAQIEAFFQARQGTEFIEAFPLDDPAEPNRWTNQTGPFQALARVLHWTINWRSRTLHIPLKRRFYAGWRPHGGSQWWALSHQAITWIACYRRDHPALERYFRFVFIPDETMLQTMLANSPFAPRLSAEPVHYIDWLRPNPRYPRTLDDEDLPRIAATPELFARKLNEHQSATLLDAIDHELL